MVAIVISILGIASLLSAVYLRERIRGKLPNETLPHLQLLFRIAVIVSFIMFISALYILISK